MTVLRRRHTRCRANPPQPTARSASGPNRVIELFATGAIRVDDARHVILPRIGRLRTAEATTKLLCRVTAGSARILRATVTREADRWFVSFTCVVQRPVVADNGGEDIVGVDLGVATWAARTPYARGVAERSGTAGDGDDEAGTGAVPEPSSATGGPSSARTPLVRR